MQQLLSPTRCPVWPGFSDYLLATLSNHKEPAVNLHHLLPPSRLFGTLLAVLALAASLPVRAATDCKPHPLFTPMQGYHAIQCETSDFDAKEIPVRMISDREAEKMTIEGRYDMVVYELDEGVTPSSPLKILRNHLDAARAKGATVVMQGGAQSFMAGEWTNIQQQIATLRITQGGREYWVHLGSVNDGDYYAIASITPEAMAQEVSANELLEQFDRQGFLRLDVHFDTGRATIRAESASILDQAAAMLKQASSARVEIGGHTDNVGNAAANLTLSQQRAESVRAALVQRGVAAGSLSAKGYGDTAPVADNRTEEGRAANRRVEISKTGGAIGAASAKPARPVVTPVDGRDGKPESRAGRFARDRAQNAGYSAEAEAGAKADNTAREKARSVLDRIF